jgi:hypothetical protein
MAEITSGQRPKLGPPFDSSRHTMATVVFGDLADDVRVADRGTEASLRGKRTAGRYVHHGRAGNSLAPEPNPAKRSIPCRLRSSSRTGASS